MAEFDCRIAIEERIPYTEAEIAELNEFHDRMDALDVYVVMEQDDEQRDEDSVEKA